MGGVDGNAGDGGPKGRFVYSTKTSLYGRSTFFDNGTYPVKTFGDLFLRCAEVAGSHHALNRAYSYSFVMQHPGTESSRRSKPPSSWWRCTG